MEKHKPIEFKFSEQNAGFSEITRKFSDDGQSVVVIGKRPDNYYTFARYKWDLSEIEYLGSGYWSPREEGSIFQNKELATKEAILTLNYSN